MTSKDKLESISKPKNALAYCFDGEGFLLPTMTSLASLLSHNQDNLPCDIHLFVKDCSSRVQEGVAFISESFSFPLNLHQHHNDIRDHISKKGPFPSSSFYRLDLADLLKDYSRVLYLDGDTIIYNGIADLFSEMSSEENYPLFGASDHKVQYGYFYERYKEELGSNEVLMPVINAGVLGINTMLFNEMQYRNEYIKLGLRISEIQYADQDLINLQNHITGGVSIKFIDPRYNYHSGYIRFPMSGTYYHSHGEIKDSKNKMIIRHFTGKKPRQLQSIENNDIDYESFAKIVRSFDPNWCVNVPFNIKYSAYIFLMRNLCLAIDNDDIFCKVRTSLKKIKKHF